MIPQFEIAVRSSIMGLPGINIYNEACCGSGKV
jgi:hypothetical protein